MRLQYTYKTSEDKVPFGLPITPSYVYLSKDVKAYSRVPLNKTEKKDDGGSACINGAVSFSAQPILKYYIMLTQF